MSTIKQQLLHRYAAILIRLARHYIKRFKPTIVVVAGSIGKTSTTQAITTVLGQRYKVRTTIKSYNVAHSLPLSIFGEELPTTKPGWLTLLPTLVRKSRQRQPFDTLVLEIGTDHPGELAGFAYLKPRIGVLTAITPEHMEYFKTLDAVAREELSPVKYCETYLVDASMVAAKYRAGLPDNAQLYGTDRYRVTQVSRDGFYLSVSLHLNDVELSEIKTHYVGEQSLHALLAAATVGEQLGLTKRQLSAGIAALQPVPGRLRLLQGIRGSHLLDDSYNASPEAVTAALTSLGEVPGKHKIAVLGSMNELGSSSAQAHKEIGLACDPAVLDLLITVGTDASEHLAEAARAAGCKVLSTDSPYTAAQLVADHLKPDTTVLIRGSQNRVFTEETVKLLLADPSDQEQLVRQSPYWMRIKQRQFGTPPSTLDA